MAKPDRLRPFPAPSRPRFGIEIAILSALAAVALLFCWFLVSAQVHRGSEDALWRRNERVRNAVELVAEGYIRNRLQVLAEQARDTTAHFHGQVQGGSLSESEAKQRTRDILGSQSIGLQGGICVFNSAREIEVQPRADSFLAVALPRLALRLAPGKLQPGHHEYGWQGVGDNESEVVALHTLVFEPWGWGITAICHKMELLGQAPRKELERATRLGEPMTQEPGALEHGYSFVVSMDGPVIVHPTLQGNDFSKERDAKGEYLLARMREDEIGTFVVPWRESPDAAAVRRRFVFDRIPDLRWVVATWEPAGTLSPVLSSLRGRAVGSGLGLALLLLAGAMWGMRRVGGRAVGNLAEYGLAIEEQFAQRADASREENTGLQTKLAESERIQRHLEETNRDLSSWVDELKQSSHEIQILNQMGDLLQACTTVEETDGVIMQLAAELFPDESGTLSRFNDEQSMLETVATWGDPLGGEGDFAIEDCWGLRRGKAHSAESAEPELLCPHLPGPPPYGYVCLPMVAQGELLGLLHVQWGKPDMALPEEKRVAQIESKKRLASTVTEQFALALANLKLRDILRKQSIRDALTGLYNRRWMEESLRREIHRSGRRETPMGIIMLDVDHFKNFNDTYGHEDGDILLRELGAILQANVRQEDIACRYGGEEFLIIMPDAPLPVAHQRAELLRERVRGGLKLKQELTTISVGVAVYPDHGLTSEAVLAAADQALYQAKDQGRDRVVVWTTDDPDGES